MKTKHLALIVAATLLGCLFNVPQIHATPAFTPGITETQGPTYTPTHYVDFVGGNDNNNGTSDSSPWQHAPGMPGGTGSHTPVAGNVIALKRGSVWRKTGTWNIGQSGSSGNPIIYTAYGTGALPKYTVVELYSSGWTVHSGNVWKRTTGGSVQRVYVNEEGMGEADSVATVGQASIVNGNNTGIIKYWKHESGILYLYSPAGNPGTVSVVEGLQGGIPHAISLINRSHVYLDRLAAYGGNDISVRLRTEGTEKPPPDRGVGGDGGTIIAGHAWRPLSTCTSPSRIGSDPLCLADISVD